jgi:lipid A 3-O-deacylase
MEKHDVRISMLSGRECIRMGFKLIVLGLVFLGFTFQCEASETGPLTPNKVPSGSSSIFAKDRLSAQFVAGALFGPVSWVQRHPVFNYAQTNLRFGWMATEPGNVRYFGTGNIELLFELTNSFVFSGFGNYVSGFTLLGRYNFLSSNPHWVPYFQIGGGVVVTDAHKDLSQRAIGQSVEFTALGGLGVHYFIGRRWSLDGEVMFHHISNAGLAERNGGANAVGGLLGLTRYFDRLWN